MASCKTATPNQKSSGLIVGQGGQAKVDTSRLPPVRLSSPLTDTLKAMNLKSVLVALATVSLSSVNVFPLAQAATLFSKAEVDPSRFVAVASPYANGSQHQLLIIEQIANTRSCWRESGSYPTVVDPLLTQFDFTGVCGRSIDSNGYSIRMADQDLGWQYSLRVVERGGELRLVGVSTMNRNLPELQIGRAYGSTRGFAKLFLNPGWRMTKRVYNGQTLGHVYLTNDAPLSTAAIATVPENPAPVVRPLPPVERPAIPAPVRPLPPTSERPQPLPAPAPVRPRPLPVPPRVTPTPAPTPLPAPTPSRINPGDYVVPTVVIYE